MELAQLLAKYTPISLEEMDGVKLMDRTDTKYVLRLDQLMQVLEMIQEEYRVLEVAGVRMSKYETLYYDTPELSMYHQHQNQKRNRYKIRMRNYVESNLNFFEIKFKSNKGRTVKDRIKLSKLTKRLEKNEEDLLFDKTGIRYQDIQPQIWVNYHRTTLVAKQSCERVTIDTNLHFLKGEVAKSYEQLVIVEVKQERALKSPISEALKSLSVREGSLSKYCLGIMSTVPGIKQNNFKTNLRTINKLVYANS